MNTAGGLMYLVSLANIPVFLFGFFAGDLTVALLGCGFGMASLALGAWLSGRPR